MTSNMVWVTALFGLLMVLLSVSMIVNPGRFARGIVTFSEMRFFHAFEIVSRIGFGVAALVGAGQTRFPAVMTVMGWVLVAVGVGLLLTPPSQHRRFAAWSAERFQRVFRPAGLLSLLFGLFILYAALADSWSASAA